MSGYYDEEQKHHCSCGALSTYQTFSGGREFYCPSCGNQATYPEGEGGPVARMMTNDENKYKFRRMMYDEIAKVKKELGRDLTHEECEAAYYDWLNKQPGEE